ncbi:MAG: twin-arginine translocase TatA/TatE family subunit [Hyphomicrobiales bacterium]|nr:twin-arginine translocase TatA/TatE family subunit [Hyphomicrobiales bacterium]MDE2113934.1 twin-arginine translocase TatA/TatE family subunit [Hyphomicrobiales bacterium]
MFDLDFGKLIIVGVMALIFIGPKELPGVLRQLGQAYGKMQRMAAEFKGQLMDAINEADVDGLRKDLAEVTDAAKLDFDMKALTHFDSDTTSSSAHDFSENLIAPEPAENILAPKAPSKPRAKSKTASAKAASADNAPPAAEPKLAKPKVTKPRVAKAKAEKPATAKVKSSPVQAAPALAGSPDIATHENEA